MAKGEEMDTGFSFWIVYDWPEITASKFKTMLVKKLIKTGVKIAYKAVKGKEVRI